MDGAGIDGAVEAPPEAFEAEQLLDQKAAGSRRCSACLRARATARADGSTAGTHMARARRRRSVCSPAPCSHVEPSARAVARARKQALQRRLPPPSWSRSCSASNASGGASTAPSMPAPSIALSRRIAAPTPPRWQRGGVGGQLYLLCFGDHERGRGGPRRLSAVELRAAFASGWRVDAVEGSRIESPIYPAGQRVAVEHPPVIR